jgi:hypothetical protein
MVTVLEVYRASYYGVRVPGRLGESTRREFSLLRDLKIDMAVARAGGIMDFNLPPAGGENGPRGPGGHESRPRVTDGNSVT